MLVQLHVCLACMLLAQGGVTPDYYQFPTQSHPSLIPPLPWLFFYLQMASRNHVFITHAQSGDMSREEFRDIIADNSSATGIIVAKEAHTEEGQHLHAACFGSFRSDRLAKALHAAMPDKHVNVLFAHKPIKSKKIGAKWPLIDMVVYITDPKKVKDVDDAPLIWVLDREDIVTAEAFCDFYEEKYATPTVKSLMEQLKECRHAKGTLNDAVGMVVEGLNKETG